MSATSLFHEEDWLLRITLFVRLLPHGEQIVRGPASAFGLPMKPAQNKSHRPGPPQDRYAHAESLSAWQEKQLPFTQLRNVCRCAYFCQDG